MIELYLVRHGETDYNKNGRYLGRADIPLNLVGVTQAKELAQKARDLKINVIYCSPLKRAVETTKFINSKHNCKIIIGDHFIERSVGVYEGLTKEEAKKKYPDLYEQNITRVFYKAPPGGETINEAIDRVFSGLDEIKKQDKCSKIMIVTHGFITKIINKYFNPGISEQEFFDFSLTNAEIKKYVFDNLSTKS